MFEKLSAIFLSIYMGIISIIGFQGERAQQDKIHRPTPVIVDKESYTISGQPYATPTPPQPSEKALKLSSFIVVNYNETEVKGLKKKFGYEDKTNLEFIKLWALDLDRDPALLALTEAFVQKATAQINKPVNNYYDQTTKVNTQNIENSLEDIKVQQKSLQNDMRMDCIRNSGVPVGYSCY